MKKNLILVALFISVCVIVPAACNLKAERFVISMYKIDESGNKVLNITTAAVGERVYVDNSQAPCKQYYTIYWGDNGYGKELYRDYTYPGTYTVKYECKPHSASRKKNITLSKYNRANATYTITMTAQEQKQKSRE
jgi:hypothetical protein